MEHIPKINRKNVRKLYKKIKPVLKVRGEYREIIGYKDDKPGGKDTTFVSNPPGLFDIAVTWNPLLGDEINGLTKLEDIRTYHSCGYYGIFKPSIAEVLMQIPQSLLEKTVAFEVDPDDEEIVVISGSCHGARTRLYGSRV